jgi:hypothetical protein
MSDTPPETPSVEVMKLWDRSPHQAFTDLIRFNDRWFCAFREGEGHVSPDGAIRILTSPDGERWTSAARLASASEDLRDPKLAIGPNGDLTLLAGAALRAPAGFTHRSYVWSSRNGADWGEARPAGEPGVWLWRAVWHRGVAYGVGYGTGQDRFARLYSSRDGEEWDVRVPRLFDRGYPNEAALLFGEDDSALCLIRRDGAEPTAQLGISSPPYREWIWKDLGVRIGGPQMIGLPGKRIAAALRWHEGGAPRTSLAWLDPATARLTEFLPLPSGGDSSYPGMVWHEDRLWVSYYSSHEGRTSVYLAKAQLPTTDLSDSPDASE